MVISSDFPERVGNPETDMPSLLDKLHHLQMFTIEGAGWFDHPWIGHSILAIIQRSPLVHLAIKSYGFPKRQQLGFVLPPTLKHLALDTCYVHPDGDIHIEGFDEHDQMDEPCMLDRLECSDKELVTDWVLDPNQSILISKVQTLDLKLSDDPEIFGNASRILARLGSSLQSLNIFCNAPSMSLHSVHSCLLTHPTQRSPISHQISVSPSYHTRVHIKIVIGAPYLYS
jgi:hypothetical protein